MTVISAWPGPVVADRSTAIAFLGVDVVTPLTTPCIDVLFAPPSWISVKVQTELEGSESYDARYRLTAESSRSGPPGTANGTRWPSTSQVQLSETTNGPAAPGAFRSPVTTFAASSEVRSKVFLAVTVTLVTSPLPDFLGIVTTPSAGTRVETVAPADPDSTTVHRVPPG